MQTEGLDGAAGRRPQSRVGVAELLEQVLEEGASDLHLTAGAKPTVRVNGRLGPWRTTRCSSRPRPRR